MKKLLVIPLLLAVVGCQQESPESKYPSRYQAEKACFDWMDKEKVGVEYRTCENEKETRQVLGIMDEKVIKQYRY